MRMSGFKRGGLSRMLPQNYIDTNLPKCPMCGTNEPYWKLKDKLGTMRTMFLCGKCGCILSAARADVVGIIKFTAVGMFNAIGKEASGKSVATTYIKVEEVGNAQTTKMYEGKEMPIEELQELADSL